MDAVLLKTRLEADNILCFIKDENMGAMYLNVVGGVALQVTSGDVEAALKIVEAFESGK